MKSLLFAAATVFALSPTYGAEDGFVDLFNGKDLSGWFVQPENPKVWNVQKGGVLARHVQSNYIWTKETFGDFIIEMEFKVSPGCNSGLFFRTDPNNPVQGGFEMQIMDSFGKDPDKHDCGALYDAREPSVNAVKKAGEWNTLRLEVKGPKIICDINGQRVQDLNLDDWKTPEKNPDGSKNKFKTALKDLPRTGHIGFQDHGHDVWYRNIRLKKL